MPKIIPVQYLEDNRNRVTSISSTNTDEQYPSARSVYDAISTVSERYKNIGGENKLNFYNPDLIDISYMKSVPGWEVSFLDKDSLIDSKVSSKVTTTNRYFSGDTNTSRHYEIEFTTNDNFIDMDFKTSTSTAHDNSCRISNISITSLGETPLVLNGEHQRTFAENEEIYSTSFENDSHGWELCKYSLRTTDAYHDGTNSLYLKWRSWNSMAKQTFKVTPGVTYTLSLYAKAKAGGTNVQVYDGESIDKTINPVLAYKYYNSTGWGKVTLTFVPTGNRITVNFACSGNDTYDEVYVDDISISYSIPGMLNLYNVTLNGSSSVNTIEKSITASGSGNWSTYVSIPLSNVRVGQAYTMKFDADVSNAGVNVTGTNIQMLRKAYVGASGHYMVTFMPTETSGVKLGFMGSGNGALDKVLIRNINIYSQDEPLGIMSDGLSRLGIHDGCEYRNPYVIIPSFNAKGVKCISTGPISVYAGVKHKLSFDVFYTQSNTYDWMPYTTFTDEDKVAFVTDGCNCRESLQLGGPWVGDIISDIHRARVNISVPTHNGSEKLFTPTMLEVGYDITNNVKLTIEVKGYRNGSLQYEEVWQGASPNYDAEVSHKRNALIPLQDYDVDNLLVIFRPTVTPGTTLKTRQFISRIALHGSKDEESINNRAYKYEPTKDVKFFNRVFADAFVGDIDDGSVD